METKFLQKEDNLLTELGNWNSIEKLCAGVYGEAVLKDRNFQRIKLQEYQRLYNKYDTRESASLDQHALHKMLRYQSRKIEQHLYQNPVRRILQRSADRIVFRIRKRLRVGQALPAFEAGNLPLPQVFDPAKERGNDLPSKQPEQIQQRPEGWWIQNLGQKGKNEKKQGMHIH
ncbi:MAG TPA: hypothetical protein VN081_02820 [Dongiaceae bacterium]|nr:hypothetical protein [Dongiaceae bacterium]